MDAGAGGAAGAGALDSELAVTGPLPDALLLATGSTKSVLLLEGGMLADAPLSTSNGPFTRPKVADSTILLRRHLL